MQDLNDKSTSDTLTAAEWNQVPSELQNIIEALGITLSAGDLNQLGKAIAGYIANGNFYTDSGSANAYVLTSIGSKQSITAYTDGAEFEFIAANDNAAGSSTVNVESLGPIDIVTREGNNPAAGEISGRTVLRYDSGSGDAVLQTFVKPVDAITNHIRCGNTQLWDGSTGRSDFSVLSLPATTFETIGPTAASSDNTWTDLDQVPSNASAIIVGVTLSVTSLIAGLVNIFGWFAHGDTGSPSSTAADRAVGLQIDADAGGETFINEGLTMIIPVNSSNEFQARWDDNLTSGSSFNLSYRGFITD